MLKLVFLTLKKWQNHIWRSPESAIFEFANSIHMSAIRLKRPEDQREPYLKEQRLSKLNLSMTKERWQEQKQQHQVRENKNQERER